MALNNSDLHYNRSTVSYSFTQNSYIPSKYGVVHINIFTFSKHFFIMNL